MRLPILTVTAALALALALPGAAAAQIEIYATSASGAATDFVFGHPNTVSLRGTLDAPSGGQTIKVRQVAADQSCPSATGNEVTDVANFVAWVPPGDPVNVNAVSSSIYPNYRDARFCIYVYFQYGGGGEANPNTSYSQVVHFRDPGGSVSWFDVASATSPGVPFFALVGRNELQSGASVAVVPAASKCPSSDPGGAGHVTIAPSGAVDFTGFGDVAVPVGFWRGCAYVPGGSASVLAAEATFSRAPKRGWRPRYKLVRGSVRLKGGRLALGSANCPGPCSVKITATAGGRRVASGRVASSGRGTLRLKLKATAAGRALARRGVAAKVRLTSVIDLNESVKRVKLRLR